MLLNTDTPVLRLALPIASRRSAWAAPTMVKGGLVGSNVRSRTPGPVFAGPAGPVRISWMVPRAALLSFTTRPALLALMKGAVAPAPLIHSTTRRCSVAVPAVRAGAGEGRGAGPDPLPLPPPPTRVAARPAPLPGRAAFRAAGARGGCRPAG